MATKERIYIDREFVDIADRLVRRAIPGSHSDQGVFRDTRELAVFAAGLGFRKDRKRDVEKNGREIKLEAVERIEFGGSDVVNALSVAATRDVAILAPEKELERAELFERYMNGGLEYISGMAGAEVTAMEVLINIITIEHAPKQAQEQMLDLLGQRL